MSNRDVGICETAKQSVKSAQGWRVPPRSNSMTVTRKVFLTIGVLVVAFFGFGFYRANTHDGQARSAERLAIDNCRASFERSPSSTVDELCLRLEADYRQKWRRAP